MQDLRFSERALGMQIDFKPELRTAPWVVLQPPVL